MIPLKVVSTINRDGLWKLTMRKKNRRARYLVPKRESGASHAMRWRGEGSPAKTAKSPQVLSPVS